MVLTAFKSNSLFERDHVRLSAAEHHLRWVKAQPDVKQLRTGDLIFRHGRGFTSNALMNFGLREKKYSHAGIVTIENGKVFVYHAVGGEENLTNRLRKDPLEMFCNPSSIHAFAVYRTDLKPEQVIKVMAIANEYYQSGLEFDTKFDLETNDKMYCTEFVYKVFGQALGNENYISLSAFSGKQYIACDDLYCNPHCSEIYSYTY